MAQSRPHFRPARMGRLKMLSGQRGTNAPGDLRGWWAWLTRFATQSRRARAAVARVRTVPPTPPARAARWIDCGPCEAQPEPSRARSALPGVADAARRVGLPVGTRRWWRWWRRAHRGGGWRRTLSAARAGARKSQRVARLRAGVRRGGAGWVQTSHTAHHLTRAVGWTGACPLPWGWWWRKRRTGGSCAVLPSGGAGRSRVMSRLMQRAACTAGPSSTPTPQSATRWASF
mmetsp:Transcript_8190/g.20616  ORF Transcript_8190/g.20616 Transcript_8190/m.20616 type:complete len:231 (-) Transcript_8190:43-735(-)